MTGAEPPVPLALANGFDVPFLARIDLHGLKQDRRSHSTSRHSVLAPSSRISLSSLRSQHDPSDDTTPSRKPRVSGMARRTLGIILLLVTVFLWTASSFLASFIFADDTYSKPFFVTYVNTSFFAVSLIPIIVRRHGGHFVVVEKLRRKLMGRMSSLGHLVGPRAYESVKPDDNYEDAIAEGETLLPGHSSSSLNASRPDRGLPSSSQSSRAQAAAGKHHEHVKLDLKETAKLSLEFCMLWFAANYFVAACLKYTTVASSTILTSTSSIFTLLFGTLLHVEIFTVRKLLGVLASLLGIILISTVDITTADDDSSRGSFPHKSPSQLAIGDALAFLSAILYGFYAILMKKRIGDEGRVDMPLFFGLVGLFNLLILWPGFILLHFFGDEPFALPPTGRIWLIVLVNSTTSLLSDFCWAYAMLLTSPLIVTVGLSLTIPLSLVGEMILRGEFEGWVYWIGAGVVFLGFLVVSWEGAPDGNQSLDGDEQVTG